jgi:hypothetical protein
VAVPAAGLVAHLEPVGQGLQGGQHLLDGPHLGAVDDRPGLAEHADGDAGAVDVESDVKHGCLQVGIVRKGTAKSHTTGPTEGSYIVSPRLGQAGRGDRRALRRRWDPLRLDTEVRTARRQEGSSRRFADVSSRPGGMPSVKETEVLRNQSFPREEAAGREGIPSRGSPRSGSAGDGGDSTAGCTERVLGRVRGFSLIRSERNEFLGLPRPDDLERGLPRRPLPLSRPQGAPGHSLESVQPGGLEPP